MNPLHLDMPPMPVMPGEEEFILNQLTPGVIASDGEAGRLTTIWRYQITEGFALLFKAEHTFSVFLADAAGTEVPFQSGVYVEKRSPDNVPQINIWNGLYQQARDFVHELDLAHLKVPPLAEAIVIPEYWWLVIAVKATPVIAAATSFFELRIAKMGGELI